MRGWGTCGTVRKSFTWTVALHALSLDTLGITNFNRAFTLAIALLTLTIPNFSLTFAISTFAVFLAFSITVSVTVTTIIGVVIGPGTGGGDYSGYGCWGCWGTGWTNRSGTHRWVRWWVRGETLSCSMKFCPQTRKLVLVLLTNFSMLRFQFIKGLADDV